MQIHELKIKKTKSRKRIGRGGKKGTYSGRGVKGQKSRSGVSINPIFEGGRSTLIEHLPKLRGFKSHYPKNQVVTLEKLDKYFSASDVVNPQTLCDKKLISKIRIGVKILATGEIKKNLTIEKCLVSKSAKEKIEKAGGAVQN
ncbi:MAG: 50S ribosomal protein L15 [Parcubacteria group bacterium]|jgi:large subunit ribosomal protein L15